MPGLLLSLAPDLVTSTGHYLLYERQIARQCRDRDVDHVSLTGYVTDPDAVAHAPSALQETFAFGSKYLAHLDPNSRADADAIDSYGRAVARRINAFKPRARGRLHVFSYMSSDIECKVMAEIAAAYPDVAFALNIFWVPDLNAIDHIKAVSEHPNVTLLAQAGALQDALKAAGIAVRRLPHPAPNETEGLDLERARPVRCYIPVKPVAGKAISAQSPWLTALARHDHERVESPSGFIYLKPGCDGPVGWTRDRGEAQDSGWFDPYLDFLTQVDTVILPYEPAEFALRTSGISADCALCGTAIACLEGTDMARRADTIDLVTREATLVGDVQRWIERERTAQARSAKARAYLEENAWSGFVDVILEAASTGLRTTAPAGPRPRAGEIAPARRVDDGPPGLEALQTIKAMTGLAWAPLRLTSDRFRHALKANAAGGRLSCLVYLDPFGIVARIAVDLFTSSVLYVQRVHSVAASVSVRFRNGRVVIDTAFTSLVREPMFYGFDGVRPPAQLIRDGARDLAATLLAFRRPEARKTGLIRADGATLAFEALGFDGYAIERRQDALTVRRGGAPVTSCLLWKVRSSAPAWSIRLIEAAEGVSLQLTEPGGKRTRLNPGEALWLNTRGARETALEVRVLGAMDGSGVLELSA